MITEKAWSDRQRLTQQQALVLQNSLIAKQEALKASRQSREPYDDLLQEAYKGLVRAAERFEPEKGIPYQVYARRYAKGEIQHYLRDKGYGVVKPPRPWLEKVASVRKYHRAQLAAKREITELQAAEESGVSAAEWQEMLRARGRICTAIPDKFELAGPQDDPDMAAVNEAVESLPEPLRSCVIEFYFNQCKVAQIARQRNVQPKKVREWLRAALDQLQPKLKEIL